jgi:single-strand DNA-binding protein
MSNKLYGIARLGRDIEIRDVGNPSQPVGNLSLAFNYGKKDPQTGKRPTQWIDGTLWGARADSLAPYLLKGASILVTLDDVHIETFTKGDGAPGHKMVGRVSDIDLAGAPPAGQAAPQQQAAAPRQAAPARQAPARTAVPAQRQAAPAATGFDDMDDDIPF